MSVAVQFPPALHTPYRQNRHAAAPPASLTAQRPGIISLSKPLSQQPQQRSPRQRKAAPSATPKEKAKKPRSRPTSDEDDDKRGRRNHDKAEKPQEKTLEKSPGSPKARRPRQPQTPDDAQRLTKHRRGFTKSTPALCEAVAAAGSAPVPVPQLTNSASHPSGLSRSAPLATSMPQSMPARMRKTLSSGPSSPSKDLPPSPSPPHRARASKPPHTAPLTGAFPRRHERSPSGGLFDMSIDDDNDEPQDIPVLFRPRVGDKAYAGGRFQNGPDPQMLPAPSFLSGF